MTTNSCGRSVMDTVNHEGVELKEEELSEEQRAFLDRFDLTAEVFTYPVEE